MLEMVGGLWKGSISLCGSSVRGAPSWGSGGGGQRAQGTDITPQCHGGLFTENSES